MAPEAYSATLLFFRIVHTFLGVIGMSRCVTPQVE
jgi:hypothetical protein